MLETSTLDRQGLIDLRSWLSSLKEPAVRTRSLTGGHVSSSKWNIKLRLYLLEYLAKDCEPELLLLVSGERLPCSGPRPPPPPFKVRAKSSHYSHYLQLFDAAATQKIFLPSDTCYKGSERASERTECVRRADVLCACRCRRNLRENGRNDRVRVRVCSPCAVRRKLARIGAKWAKKELGSRRRVH